MPLARYGILGGKLGTHEDTLLRFWFSNYLGYLSSSQIVKFRQAAPSAASLCGPVLTLTW